MPTVFIPYESKRRSAPARDRLLICGSALVLSLLVAVSTLRAQNTIPADREALLKGEVMDLAALADKNNLPGPKQVLALKAELGLTRDQAKKTEALEKVFGSSAVAKGEEIVLAEEELAQSFEAGTVTEKGLRAKLEQIGKLRAELRFIHLQAYLRMKQILTPDQVKLFTELRSREIQR